jgi:predicted NAD-dependent protein-ADP-ribosyltransferase YbiA (DUF1768 family)
MTDILLFGDSLADNRVGFSKSKFEKVKDRNDPKWQRLNEIPQWRKCLSSLHSHRLLEIDGKVFSTPEHYYQFKKFENVDDQIANKFCHCGDFGTMTGKQVRQMGKSYRLTDEQWSNWKSIEKYCKDKVKIIKFQQGNLCYETLLETRDAELWSYAPRCSTFRMTNFETLRSLLQSQNISPL